MQYIVYAMIYVLMAAFLCSRIGLENPKNKKGTKNADIDN